MEAFGVYSLVFFFGLSCISFQNAVVNAPLSTELNRVRLSSFGRLLGYYNLTNLLYCLVVMVAGAAAAWIIGVSVPVLWLYLMALLMREFWKGILFCLDDAVLVMLMDMVFATATLTGLLVLKPTSVEQALLVIGTSMWSFALVLMLRPILRRWSGIATCRRFFHRHIWHKARWTLVGVLTTELHSRSYLFLTGSVFGTGAVGTLQSARIPFGPLSLMITAWSRFSRPVLSRWKRRRLLYLSGSLGFFALGNLAFFALLWVWWNEVVAYVFKDLGVGLFDIVILWFVLTLFLHLRTAVSVYHQSNDDFRFVSMTGIQGLVITLVACGVVIGMDEYRWMPLALVAGEVWMLLLLLKPIVIKRA